MTPGVLRAVSAGAVLLARWPAVTGAQGDASLERPQYQLVRYDEDWSLLRRPDLRSEWWDRLKYIPLGRTGGAYLSFGGEARLRYEAYRNPMFGADPPDPGGYLLQRYLLHADAHWRGRLRGFVQLQSSLESGRAGGPRAFDENRLDLHQAFLQLRLGRAEGGEAVLRAGRQELEFGSSRLVSVHDNLNVRQSFDAVRILFNSGAWRSTTWVARPVQLERGVFDDVGDSTRLLWGASFTHAGGLLAWPSLAVYYAGLHHLNARFDQGTADELRHTVGVRLRRPTGPWDSNLEVSVQLGRFGQGRIRAWDMGADNGITFASAPLSPRVGLRLDVTSGDGDPADPDLGTFNALFPNTAYSGLSGLIGPGNSIDIDPSVRLAPGPTTRVTAGVAFFWRARTADGVYNLAITPARTGRLSSSRYVGSQATLELAWDPSSHITYLATYTRFVAGPFLRETPPGESVQALMSWVRYRF